jgi:hypothetical protein
MMPSLDKMPVRANITAEDFLLSHGKITAKTLHSKKLAEQEINNVLTALTKHGLLLNCNEGKVSELANLRFGIERRGVASVRSEIEDKIWNDEELSLMERTLAIDLAGILLMTDKEFTQHQRARSQPRALLLSLIKKGQAEAGHF